MSKAKDKGRRAKGKSEEGNLIKSSSRVGASTLLPFALCLLPFALLLFASSAPKGAEPAAAVLSEAEADAALLDAARASLGGREGAIVVLDAQTGRVRALAGGRAAFEEATPPGSAVKPFTMLAALRAGSLEEGTRVACRRRYKQDGFKITCSQPR
jgi:hypothetical protein